MSEECAEAVIRLLKANPEIRRLEVTGGAPELHRVFRRLVKELRALGIEVADRCNLAVLLERGQEDLAQFLGDHQVAVIASLPCYTQENVDCQRGDGVFQKSIHALRLLNGLGYGRAESPLRLDLVYNPLGAYLPAPQEELERDYRQRLAEDFGVEFHRLYTLTNMPINRFASSLHRVGELDEYLELLADSFNVETVAGLMCRDQLSVGWDGGVYDCDFNLILGLPVMLDHEPARVERLGLLADLAALPIATGSHCFGCTAGSGSSCTGALV
jgi:radical SAM/Cys-rich protein